MAVAEGAALDVLASHAGVESFEEQGANGQGLGGGPVHTSPGLEHLGLLLGLPGQRPMEGEALRHGGQGGAHLLQGRHGQPRGLLGVHVVVRRGQGLPGRVLALSAQPHVVGHREGVAAIPRRVKGIIYDLDHALHLVLAEGVFSQEAILVEGEGLRVLADALVHERLGEGWLVDLVVAMLAVADEIDDHILVEGLAPVRGELEDSANSLDVVGVHVEDRAVEGLSQIRGVPGGAALLRGGCEADLVVADHVHSAPCLVCVEPGHLHGLVDHALASKGCISVHDHGQHPVPSLIAKKVHLGPGLAHNEGVHGLEV
mmetsp:Transcript_27158/g.79094  ORF Transcript_27158/g.79094 Transcript_27158/m.79094 type:complete len:315 (-) Transcript_27158:1704-2648(-)